MTLIEFHLYTGNTIPNYTVQTYYPKSNHPSPKVSFDTFNGEVKTFAMNFAFFIL
jgi:hypothetical protein